MGFPLLFPNKKKEESNPKIDPLTGENYEDWVDDDCKDDLELENWIDEMDWDDDGFDDDEMDDF